MQHRNLNTDPGYIPMAIDNIINRGTVKDWADMVAAAKTNPQIRRDIADLCKARFDQWDSEADYQLYGFWQKWADGDESVLDQVDWDYLEPDTVWPYPYTVVIGPVEHPKVMRAKSQHRPQKPNLDEVFAALDTVKLPEDFMTDADRDRRPPQERPEQDKRSG